MKAQFFPYADEKISKKTPYFTYGLIVANVAVFIISLFSFEYLITTFGFIPANPDIVSMFTHMFLHGGVLHLFVNMWYLYIFGDNMEVAFGGGKFIVFYIISGLFALAFHYITNPLSAIPVVGASGAVSGVLGAYLVLLPHMKIRAVGFYTLWKLPTYVIIGSWFIFQLLFALYGLFFGDTSNIAFWAHIGGFIMGVMIGLIYNKRKWVKLVKRYRKR